MTKSTSIWFVWPFAIQSGKKREHFEYVIVDMLCWPCSLYCLFHCLDIPGERVFSGLPVRNIYSTVAFILCMMWSAYWCQNTILCLFGHQSSFTQMYAMCDKIDALVLNTVSFKMLLNTSANLRSHTEKFQDNKHYLSPQISSKECVVN